MGHGPGYRIYLVLYPMHQVSIMPYLLGYWQKLQTVPLTPGAQAMYVTLLYYLNLNNRVQPFRVSNIQVCAMANIRPGTLDKVKKELVGKGYITIEKGIGQVAPAYYLPLTKDSSKESSRESSRNSSKDSSTSKEYKSNNIYITPTLQEVQAYIKAHHFRVDAQAFYDHYSSLGWANIYGVPIKDWHSAVRVWHSKNDTAEEEDIKKLKRQSKKQVADYDKEYIKGWEKSSKYDHLFFKENTKGKE